jgi:hypothetical protein
MRKAWLGGGIAFVVLAVALLALGLWEGLVGVGASMRRVELPGFHELDLKEPGLYAGLYQHQGPGPLPAAALSKMSIKVFEKDGFREVPVALNQTGETFARLGQQGMVLFNFGINQPGLYTLSGVYLDGEPGPTVAVTVISQGVRDTKPTLIVSGFFFLLFMTLGVWMIRKRNI